jgi:hypothetical protein
MSRCHLRVFRGPETSEPESQPLTGELVRVRLMDIYPLLVDALRSNRTWLRDFDQEELQISQDLYECIRAYDHCRPSA